MVSEATLRQIIEPAVKMLGCELWGFEYQQHVLRVYIETEAGVTLEDCERVSNQLSTVLDVEDPMADNYNLEVSSPGVERPLFHLEQYNRYVNHRIKLKSQVAVEGQRRFIGLLVAVTGDTLKLDVDGHEIEFAFVDIDKANVVADF